jgi:hypothetical protein
VWGGGEVRSTDEAGHFIPEKGERITEWQVQWLPNAKRNAESVRDFMKNPKEAGS